MKQLFTYIKYNTVPFLCLGAILANLWLEMPPAIGAFLSLVGTIGLFYCAGLSVRRFGLIKNTWFATLSVLIVFIGLQSLVYFLFAVNKETLSLLFTAVFLLTIQTKQPRFRHKIKHEPYRFAHPDVLLIPILIGYGLMLHKLIGASTTLALSSPWQLIGPRFFVLYGMVLLLLLMFVYQTRRHTVALAMTVLHFVLSLSIAAIIFQVGYGYDPFLHRAAQQHILEFGAIFPKTPFYIGQYVTTISLVHLFHVPLKLVDIWLVPLLSAITLPLATYVGMARGCKVKKKWARVAALLVPLYPLQMFIATTPHNFATLLTVLIVLLSPAALRFKDVRRFSGLLALLAVAVHPLSGIFALWFWVGLASLKQMKGSIFFGYILAGSVLTPLLFIAYLVLLGNPIPSPELIANNIDTFISLFQEPYYFNRNNPPILLEAIYAWRWAIPVVIGLFALVGMKYARKKYANFLIAFVPMLLVNMLLVSTWITIPNLNAYEQVQYAQRIGQLILFFILPLALYGALRWIEEQHKKRRFIFMPAALAIVLLLLTSWYLTYPQKNAISNYPGFSVSGADLAAATLIEAKNPTSTSYVVLSNILTAAASIEQFGFAHYVDAPEGEQFYYAIPSGSHLYQQYLAMLYEGQQRETMQAVLDYTSTTHAYFLVHDYWIGLDEIVAGAKESADSWETVGDGTIWVFEYWKD